MDKNSSDVSILYAAAGSLMLSLAVARRSFGGQFRKGSTAIFALAACICTVSSISIIKHLPNGILPGKRESGSNNRKSLLYQLSSLTCISISHCETPHKSDLHSFTIANTSNGKRGDKPVVDVTASSFERLVLQNDKDVFVVFFAPWCGYCKRLVPVWDALADDMKHNANIVIAQIDMTQHSVSVPGVVVHGYPTIYLFKRGHKGVPVEYRGARNIESFKAFLSHHA